jgi:non-heme chloroperoxidase
MTSPTGGDHQTRPGCGQMRYLGVRNERLAWRQHGKQGRVVVWVHGLPLDSRSWLFQERHFAGRARNFLVDLRGYGCSGKLPDPPRDVTQLYVNDLHNLITTLDLSDAVLVGFASGAHVALRYAAQHHGTVSQLVSINGSPRFRRGPDWPWGFEDTSAERFSRAAHEEGIQGITNAVLDPAAVFRDVDPAAAQRLRDWFEPMSLTAGTGTLLGFFEGMSRDDDRALLTEIRIPALLIASAIGQEVPSDVAIYMRQHIPNAAVAELPGTDHFAFATRPHLVNQLIEQVL